MAIAARIRSRERGDVLPLGTEGRWEGRFGFTGEWQAREGTM
jgi:hypothetical protein